MVITMALRRTILRGETYYFRMLVPKDCIEAIGKTEIVVSLKTKDPMATKAAVARLEAFWTARFNEARESKSNVTVKQSIPTPPDEDSASFRQGLIDQMDKNLPDIIEKETEAQLLSRFNHYRTYIKKIQDNDRWEVDFPELGVKWPLKPSISPRQDRQRRRDLIVVLNMLCEAISHEVVKPPVKQSPPSKEEKKESDGKGKSTKACPEEHDILEVAELMLAAKKRIIKTRETVKVDIRLLKEWVGNKCDITTYSKKDLIDFVQNCLPYLPANIARRGNKYEGKTLRQCIEMTKKDPEQYPPISHTTCGNRLVNIIMVFNYAKEHLGVIPINPAMGIEIPEVHVSKDMPRGFTLVELTAMWAALQAVKGDIGEKPSHYWTTILSLYHGFRLNEVCSLFLKDVYEDEDGVFVIDINDDGPLKSVKNQSSVRVVPVHPFVRDQLGFKDFVERQKSTRSEGVLFSDVKGSEAKGYRDRMSKWFAEWKKEWLAPKAQYKHFHDLRYTFIQTAQNSAKMPDRHSQEITGHSIEGVSAVHLGYSGRLKPAALLEELQKVKYGWEAIPDDSETARAPD